MRYILLCTCLICFISVQAQVDSSSLSIPGINNPVIKVANSSLKDSTYPDLIVSDGVVLNGVTFRFYASVLIDDCSTPGYRGSANGVEWYIRRDGFSRGYWILYSQFYGQYGYYINRNKTVLPPSSGWESNLEGFALFGQGNLVVGGGIDLNDKNFEIKHYHQLTQTSSQSQPTYLSSSDFKVCADGAQASTFVITGDNISNWSLVIDRNSANDIELSGQLSLVLKEDNRLVYQYRHPNQIPNNSLKSTINLQLYQYGSVCLTSRSYTVTAYRPPVLMVHGLWSKSSSFDAMESVLLSSKLYEPNFLLKLDYSSSNFREFSYNRPFIAANINLLMNRLIQSNISVGKVDFVGHSMGGILGRLHLQNGDYAQDIHKLITVNTPHAGSEMANFLADLNNPTLHDITCNSIIRYFFSNSGCNGGAITDLCVNSEAIRNVLNNTDNIRNHVEPSHAIVTLSGISTTDITELTDLSIRTPSYALKFFLDGLGQSLTGSIFNDLDHDLIVSAVSQRGGMTGQAWSLVEDQIHLGSTANPKVIEIVTDLLKSSVASPKFSQAGFNPPTITYTTPSLIAINNYVNNVVRIGSPFVGTRFEPNTIINVEVNLLGQSNGQGRQPANSLKSKLSVGEEISEIRTIVNYRDDSIYVAKKTSFPISYSLSVGDQVGKHEIIVFGKTSLGNYFTDTTYYYVGKDITTSSCKTVQSGDWTNQAVWSCGHVPIALDDVIIQPGHTVLLDSGMAEAFCRNLEILGTFSMQGSSIVIDGNRIVLDETNVLTK